MNTSTKTVLITGATAGIGEACAFHFAEKGCKLILTGRRADRLKNLSDTLQTRFGTKFQNLVFDIREKEQVENAYHSLSEEWQKIDILINNAGLALGLNTFQDGDTDDWDTMIDTNVKGLLYISRLVAKGMIKEGSGHIVNIGSVAGREVYPKGNVYCATKHAVDALTQSMRIDLLPHGIRVSQLAPGAVNTEFSLVRYKGDKAAADAVYNGFQPLVAEDIAGIVGYITSLPPHINVNDILVMPVSQASVTQIHREH